MQSRLDKGGGVAVRSNLAGCQMEGPEEQMSCSEEKPSLEQVRHLLTLQNLWSGWTEVHSLTIIWVVLQGSNDQVTSQCSLLDYRDCEELYLCCVGALRCSTISTLSSSGMP